MTDAVFLAFLLVDGALAGAIYALVALAFVVVYKASRMINFAMGEWIMLGSRIVASGMPRSGSGLVERSASDASGWWRWRWPSTASSCADCSADRCSR